MELEFLIPPIILHFLIIRPISQPWLAQSKFLWQNELVNRVDIFMILHIKVFFFLFCFFCFFSFFPFNDRLDSPAYSIQKLKYISSYNIRTETTSHFKKPNSFFFFNFFSLGPIYIISVIQEVVLLILIKYMLG